MKMNIEDEYCCLSFKWYQMFAVLTRHNNKCLQKLQSILFYWYFTLLGWPGLSCSSRSLSVKLSLSECVVSFDSDVVCFQSVKWISPLLFLFADFVVAQTCGIVKCSSGVCFNRSKNIQKMSMSMYIQWNIQTEH